MKRIAEEVSRMADIVFPPRCIGCHVHIARPTAPFCRACREAVFRVDGPKCWKCSLPRDVLPGRPHGGIDELCGTCATTRRSFAEVRAVWEYDGTIADALRRAKFGGDLAVLTDLAALMRGEAHHFLAGLREEHDAVHITSVPMHPADLRRRGFNPPSLLARQIFGSHSVESPIRKTLRRPRQTQLDRVERLRNLRGAFECVLEEPPRGAWLVVDDVMTTGATMTSMARILRRCGADAVYGLVAARTV